MLRTSILAEMNKIIKKILQESKVPEMKLIALQTTYSGKLYHGWSQRHYPGESSFSPNSG